MELIRIDNNRMLAEISFEHTEMITIYNAFAHCDIKIGHVDYDLFMNIKESDMARTFESACKIIKQLAGINEKVLPNLELIAFDPQKKVVTLLLGRNEFVAIYYALLNVPILCDEEECGIITGIEWPRFQEIKREIAFIIQRLFGSRMESHPFVQT